MSDHLANFKTTFDDWLHENQLVWIAINLPSNSMKGSDSKNTLSAKQSEELLHDLRARFERYKQRHANLEWAKLEAKLKANPTKLWSLYQMNLTGGEPDVVDYDPTTGEFVYMDCSPESPKGRVAVCYDKEGLESRKEHKPKTSAVEVATHMGIELLSEEQYRALQNLGEFDLRTSSWVQTPADIRKLGGALFGDRRFGHVFIYHNGAQSYYSSRAFRGCLIV